MADDPLKPKLNRAEILQTEKQFKAGIKLYDVDLTIMNHIVDNIVPTLEILGEPLKIPVIYGNAERWSAVKRDGYTKDVKGQLQVPLIMFKRNTVDRDDNMTSMMNRHVSYPAQTKYSQKHKYDNFSQMIGTNRPVEQYNVTMPDYVTITYEMMIWTDFTEHMNTVVEAFQYATDEYWGNKEGFKFRVKIDSFDNTTEVSEGSQRIVRTNFTMTVNAYLLPEEFANEPTTKKALTVKKVVWGTSVTDESALTISTAEKISAEKQGITGLDYLTEYYKIKENGGNTGVTEFIKLTDTPSSYTGNANKIAYVNGTADAIIFKDLELPDGTVSGSSQLDADFVNVTGDTMTGTLNVDGDVNITGILTATEFHSDIVSGSIIYQSGSTKFGDTADDTHEFTGSVLVNGTISGSTYYGDGSNLTGIATSSYDDTNTLNYINSLNVVSGSSQIDYDLIANVPSGIISGSSQLDGTTIDNLTITSVGTNTIAAQTLYVDASEFRTSYAGISINGAETEVARVPTGSYDVFYFDYVVKNGVNLRAGTLITVHDGISTNITDNTTTDLGDTTGLVMNTLISGEDILLTATTTAGSWIVKSIIRMI
jgi:ethanolamine utilization microcompartment shell protein EutS